MKGSRAFFYLVIILLLGLAGCLPPPSAQPIPQTGLDAPAAPPEIRSVEVLQSDVPQQILLVVRAVLPNTCVRLGEAAIERQGRQFTVRLPAEKAPGENCMPASLSQDQVIRLPAEPLSPGSYIVLVNGVLSSFRVTEPGGSQAAPAQAEAIQPTIAAAAVAPEAVAPTAAPPAGPAPALSPTASPSPTEAPILPPSPVAAPLALGVGQDPANCTNRAALYGTLTVPDGTPFTPGSQFKKTWLVMNTGTCTWGSAYQLVFAGGDPLGAPKKIPMPNARPRQVVQVSVDMTAPTAPQSYESAWAFESPQGYLFGLGNPATTPLAAKISVAAPPVGLPSGLDCGALRQRDMEQQVLEQINNTRAQYGLNPLELVEEISQVALKHSLEMACYDRASHHGLDGMLYNVRLQREGILFETSNEIIYSGNGGPKGSLTWWMNSPIHKPIVLSSKYTKVGIGFVFYDKNPYKQRITVDFILP